jgi:hypothetical protein
LLSVAFNLFRDWKADSRQETSDKARGRVDSLFQDSQTKMLQLQLSTKDSIIKRVENTYTSSIKASNEALARYNLQITDSLHAVVSSLKLNAANPQLLIAPLEPGKQPAFITKENGINKFSIQLISKGSTSYHILLSCYLIRDTTGNPILKSLPFSHGGSPLAENIISTRETDLPSEILAESRILVLLTGSFSKDPEGKFNIPFSAAFTFNFRENKYLMGIDMNFELLKKKLDIK